MYMVICKDSCICTRPLGLTLMIQELMMPFQGQPHSCRVVPLGSLPDPYTLILAYLCAAHIK